MRPQRDGFVLVSVLWVVALLTIITLSYHHRARLDVQAARYSLDSSQAMMAARGGVERALMDLRYKSLLDQLAPDPAIAAGAPTAFLGQPWARGGDLYAPGGAMEAGERFSEDAILYTIEDLERYVNINTTPEVVLENLPGVDRAVARRIHFLRSGVDEVGAPTGAAPVVFQDTAELRELRGITEKDWLGDGREPGLRDLLTTLGDGRINVNTAPADVLRYLPGLDEQAAKDILAWRNGADGESGSEDDRGWGEWDSFASTTGVGGDALQSLKRLCKFDSSYFKISAVATRRGGRIRSACTAVYLLSGGADAPTLVSWTEESLGAQ